MPTRRCGAGDDEARAIGMGGGEPVVGIDWSLHGWVAAAPGPRAIAFSIWASLAELAEVFAVAEAMGVDRPIGLARTRGPREGDPAAREFVGPAATACFRSRRAPFYERPPTHARRPSRSS